MQYSINLKGYGFFSFAKSTGKSLSGSLSKSTSCKYEQKPLDTTKKSATHALKIASKRAIQKTAEATGDLGGNKTAEKIRKAASKSTHGDLKKSMQIPEPTSIPEKRQKLLLNFDYYNYKYIGREWRTVRS